MGDRHIKVVDYFGTFAQVVSFNIVNFVQSGCQAG